MSVLKLPTVCLASFHDWYYSESPDKFILFGEDFDPLTHWSDLITTVMIHVTLALQVVLAWELWLSFHSNFKGLSTCLSSAHT